MIRKEKYSIEDVLSKFISPELGLELKDVQVDFDGDNISMDSHRYWNFKVNGCKCCICGVEGQFFYKEKHSEKDTKYHFNLYGVVNDQLVLMTKDHIVPKSKGGKNHIDNYQVMCHNCNTIKSNFEGEDIQIMFDYYNYCLTLDINELTMLSNELKLNKDKYDHRKFLHFNILIRKAKKSLLNDNNLVI